MLPMRPRASSLENVRSSSSKFVCSTSFKTETRVMPCRIEFDNWRVTNLPDLVMI